MIKAITWRCKQPVSLLSCLFLLSTTFLFSSSLFFSTGAAADDHGSAAAKLTTEQQKLGYSYGQMLGRQMAGSMREFDIDSEAFVSGFQDAYTGKPAKMSDQQIAETIQSHQSQQQAELNATRNSIATENLALGKTFLEENASKKGVQTTASGLQYKIIKKGEGTSPTIDDTVEVHYTGTLVNGDVFDSSVQRGQSVSFPVKGVISGWTEALQLMKPGAKWQLFIPPDLAYGANGAGRIGPNETLIFEVELLAVK